VSQYQKGKTSLDFTETRDSEWQWHQLGHMQVCISLQTDNHASTPPPSFFLLAPILNWKLAKILSWSTINKQHSSCVHDAAKNLFFVVLKQKNMSKNICFITNSHL